MTTATIASGTDMVHTALEDGVLTVTLNRPEALNALRPEMLHGLRRVVGEAVARDDVGVLVLTGAGRAFSAGIDLKVLQGVAPRAGKVGDIFDEPAAEAIHSIRDGAIPVIAKVHGFCYTGALELALHCDLIYTTVDTRFGDTHAKFGLRPTWGMSQTLAQAVGVRRAKELSFTARTFTGRDAASWGLAVEAVADREALDALVAERAAAIAGNSRAAVAAFKDLYGLAQERRPMPEALAEEVRREFKSIADTADRLAGFGS